ncbi:lysylphosphatidylglycerol synthase transmembrane domain-containing protein [Niabella sp.]|uniref:lysylphosphatidylglycerol synthase transmembrane domain-containing protein n=1 Tax=Niabella sp. TaxID=1962976 RepID=UPI00262399C8|nr:lysylphosphatidylglycerol synthase transmembrane domain-containing protein [Niabella sp.]
MDKKKVWNVLKPVLKVAFTVLALWLVYTKVDLTAVQRLWKEADSWWLIPAVAAFIACQVVTSFRLLYFFRNIGLPIPVRYNLRLYLLGMFYNLFLPSGLGGDGYKIIVLKQRYDTTHKEVFSAVFFDRLAGLWGLGFLVSCFSLAMPEVRQYSGWILLGFGGGTAIYYWVLRRYFTRVSRHFFITHLLAICTQSLQLATVAFILAALGCKTSYWPYFAIFLLSSLASLFPFSVGGLGAREVVIVWGAGIFGLDKDLAVSVSLSFYLITMMMALSAIFILFGRERKKITPPAADPAREH